MLLQNFFLSSPDHMIIIASLVQNAFCETEMMANYCKKVKKLYSVFDHLNYILSAVLCNYQTPLKFCLPPLISEWQQLTSPSSIRVSLPISKTA